MAENKYYALATFTGVVHSIFCLIFIYLKIWPMAVFNVFSPVLYFYLRKYSKQEKKYIIFIYAYTEIILHAIFATYYAGWGAGFGQYIIALVPYCFFACYELTKGRKRVVLPMILTLVASVVYLLCRHIANNTISAYELKGDVQDVLFLFNSIATFVFMYCFLTLYTYTLNEMEIRLKRQNAILDHRASTDPLTSLLNRRSMGVYLENAYESGAVFSVAMCDIDDFKTINDSFGHEAGDLVLKEIARIIRETIPEGNQICRWGGEEILILFNGHNLKETADICEELREKTDQNIIPFYDKTLHVTLTIGVAEHFKNIGIDETISAADGRLYYGKKNGKNQVVSTAGGL